MPTIAPCQQVYKVSWLDSAGQPSVIHATCDGQDTLCGGHDMYLRERRRAKSPRKYHGYSNFCLVCFKQNKKSIPWHESMPDHAMRTRTGV